jgi:electron transfer flavoprotein alpha subunit
MANVLIVTEAHAGKLRAASLSAVTFGKQMAEKIGGKLTLVVLGKGASAAAADAAKYGAAEVLVAEHDKLEHYLAETYAPIVAKAAKDKGASVVAATSTSTGKDLMPRVAALLDAGLVSDVIGIAGPTSFKRPMMAGNVIATVEVVTPIVVATVRQTEFKPAEAAGAASPIAKIDATVAESRAEFIGIAESKSERPELTEAKIIVSGGRGMREGKNFEQVAALADLLGGAMGASRAACDAGMVPNDLQVGQTGKVVAPQLYVAIAISGAIQHLAGMKGSKTIVAVNKDPEAPIFQVADYGLVTTWEQAIPALMTENNPGDQVSSRRCDDCASATGSCACATRERARARRLCACTGRAPRRSCSWIWCAVSRRSGAWSRSTCRRTDSRIHGTKHRSTSIATRSGRWRLRSA